MKIVTKCRLPRLHDKRRIVASAMLKNYLRFSIIIPIIALSSLPVIAEPPTASPSNAVTSNPRYNEFYEALQKQVKDNSPDFGAAILCVLEATDGDEKAVESWMKTAAKQGNIAAEHWITDMALSQTPVEKLLSPEVRATYQRMAKLAAKGFVPSMLDANMCLRQGIGVPKDEAAANKMLMDACKTGDFMARAHWLVSTGRVEFFSSRTKPEVESEVKRGNHYVMFRLCNLASDPAQKMEWLKKAAEAGSSDAYFALSAVASAKKPVESRTLLEEAVRRHNPEAYFVMASGLMDVKGENAAVREAGVQPDPKRAIILLKTAAALGHLRSCMALGYGYLKGQLGLPEDLQKAYFYFSHPKLSNTVALATARAYMLLNGKGVKQDTAAGIKLLEDAAKVGHPQASIILAAEYFSGKHVKPDARKASQLLSDAAAAGAPQAYVYLAYITAKGGEGLPADASMARSYLRLASMDMGDKAKQLYDQLIVKDSWEPEL